ncbi:1-aminocyclopropane-1-carboxylate deaminase/D-cysteine desulfhydrase [Pseudohongiella nitratireducens]|mgnify:CR=1 FL=1|uniref:1-aminocyclopropane-1-carboxylate deaminase/D-cysteine desulfhydrase n=1 Tax=Pseudohongiella nitratireducens TaxID=1768907 RepID=UPI0030EF8729|tara:strand:+ start:3184 stop:4200 length:1017 start_codon:yes stop_codon:yes gene_type:complete
MALTDISQDILTLAGNPGSVRITAIHDDLLRKRGVRLHLLRLDLIDVALGGNKIFKLYGNLLTAQKLGFDTLISFGGVWSNHLYALAAAGQRLGLKTKAIIRGELPAQGNHCLSFLKSCGMELYPVSRQQYRQRHDPVWQQELLSLHGPAWLIPEGGANLAGVVGCQQLAFLISQLPGGYDEVVLPCGTATTLAGLVAGISLLSRQQGTSSLSFRHPAFETREKVPAVRGMVVLKGMTSLQAEIEHWLRCQGVKHCVDWSLDASAHFGGYAKRSAEISHFNYSFWQTHGIPLEPVYSGRMMRALFQRIEDGYYPHGTRLLALHTGGLQGRSVDEADIA